MFRFRWVSSHYDFFFQKLSTLVYFVYDVKRLCDNFYHANENFVFPIKSSLRNRWKIFISGLGRLFYHKHKYLTDTQLLVKVLKSSKICLMRVIRPSTSVMTITMTKLKKSSVWKSLSWDQRDIRGSQLGSNLNKNIWFFVKTTSSRGRKRDAT